MNIVIGSDHGGFALKEELKKRLTEQGCQVKDVGCSGNETADYPEIAEKLCRTLLDEKKDFGILCCGTGIGISIAANKVKGIRCVVCPDCYSALLSRQHNNTNMLVMGSRVVGKDLALMIVDQWLQGKYEGGRHQIRLDEIQALEETGEIAKK